MVVMLLLFTVLNSLQVPRPSACPALMIFESQSELPLDVVKGKRRSQFASNKCETSWHETIALVILHIMTVLSITFNLSEVKSEVNKNEYLPSTNYDIISSHELRLTKWCKPQGEFYCFYVDMKIKKYKCLRTIWKKERCEARLCVLTINPWFKKLNKMIEKVVQQQQLTVLA